MIDDDLLDDLGTTSNSTPRYGERFSCTSALPFSSRHAGFGAILSVAPNHPVIRCIIDPRMFPLHMRDKSSGSSSSGPALPETPAPRRRERNQKPNDLKATSNPLLSVPPKIQLAQRGGSAAGALGRSSKSESRDCDSPSNLSPRSDESLSTSPASSSSVKISSPLHVQFGGSLEDRPSATFFPPLSFGVGPEPTSPAPPFVQVHLSTSQPHSLQSSRGSDYSDSDNLTSETANTDTMPSFCPHPSSITISTRGTSFHSALSSHLWRVFTDSLCIDCVDNPPKGFRITTEAGIVIGSAAAYHGSSVSKVSTFFSTYHPSRA